MAYVRKGKRRFARHLPPKAPKEATFLPNEEHLVRMLAARGATDSEMDELCGVPKGTVAKWRKIYPGFDAALDEGRTKVDGNVLFALYRNSIGYDYEEDQAVGGKVPEVLRVTRYHPAEFNAQKFWLTNRRKQEWKARESHEHSGPDGQPIPIDSRNGLIDAIVAMVQPKADPEPPKRDSRAAREARA